MMRKEREGRRALETAPLGLGCRRAPRNELAFWQIVLGDVGPIVPIIN